MDDVNIEKVSEQILHTAFRLEATDIHFQPKKKTALVYLRILQQLVPMYEFPKEIALKIISHFKFKACMDIGEHRRPQSGAMKLTFLGKEYHLRLSVLPSPFAKSLAIRILPQSETISLAKLSLFPAVTRKLQALCQRKNGLVIVSGPTGAGKTTTMYAMLYIIQKEHMKNIVTLEDPVEKKTDVFTQVEVNEKAGITYAEGLKAILRHDPDVITIGEIRDEETAKMAIRAALTGHLVITTLHTKDCIGAIVRLIELGISKHDIEQTLIGVLNQRLVQTICPYCSKNCHPYCTREKLQKLKAIFEIVTGNELEKILNDLQQLSSVQLQHSLKKQFQKAYALGYISQDTYGEWLGEYE